MARQAHCPDMVSRAGALGYTISAQSGLPRPLWGVLETTWGWRGQKELPGAECLTRETPQTLVVTGQQHLPSPKPSLSGSEWWLGNGQPGGTGQEPLHGGIRLPVLVNVFHGVSWSLKTKHLVYGSMKCLTQLCSKISQGWGFLGSLWPAKPLMPYAWIQPHLLSQSGAWGKSNPCPL